LARASADDSGRGDIEVRILIAEDDDAIATGLSQSLVEDGHVVDRVPDGLMADQALHTDAYDMLVLDLGLPHLDGLDVVRRARSRGNEVTVLVVTAREAINDRVKALDLGADDYLVKPFALAEFSARIRALIRRSTNKGVPEITLGKLRFDLVGRRTWVGDTPLELTAREAALLEALLTRIDRLVSRSQLTEALCNWEQELTDNGLDIAVHRLRRKLDGSGTRIRTIRGLGYILEESDGSESGD
jgi:two-component system OmpR family response regulator